MVPFKTCFRIALKPSLDATILHPLRPYRERSITAKEKGKDTGGKKNGVIDELRSEVGGKRNQERAYHYPIAQYGEYGGQGEGLEFGQAQGDGEREEQCGRELDQRILPGDYGLAGAAFACEHDKRQHGHELKPCQGAPAMRAA